MTTLENVASVLNDEFMAGRRTPIRFLLLPPDSNPTGEETWLHGRLWRPTPDIDVDFWDTVKAGFLKENFIVAGGQSLYRAVIDWEAYEDDPDFNVFEHVKGTPFENETTRLVGIWSEAEFDLWAERRMESLRQERVLADAGGFGVLARIAAGVLTPTFGLGAIKAGIAAGKGASTTARVVAKNMVFQEAVLAASSDTRTAEDAVLSIGLSATAGYVLGGLMRRPSRVNPGQTRAEAYEDAVTADLPRLDGTRPSPRNAGAAANPDAPPDLGIDGEGTFGGADFLQISPRDRLLQSPIEHVRVLAQQMVEVPFFLRKNLAGQATHDSVETARKAEWTFPVVEAWQTAQSAYMAYRGRPGGGIVQQHLVEAGDRISAAGARIGMAGARGRTHLSFNEFREEIFKAMVNGDVHHIPEVVEAAKGYRRLYDALRDKAIANGTFEFQHVRRIERLQQQKADLEAQATRGQAGTAELARIDRQIAEAEAAIQALRRVVTKPDGRGGRSVDDAATLQATGALLRQQLTDAGYVNRLWRIDRIDAREDEFRDIIKGWLASRGVSGNLNKAADEIIDTIRQDRPYVAIDADETGIAAGARERTFTIPTNLVLDFVEKDIDALARFHTRTFGADVELTEKFGRLDMKDQLQEIDLAYGRRIEAAQAAGAADDVKHLRRRRDADLEDIRGLRDRLRGTYGLPNDPYAPLSRFYRISRQVNMITMLGMATVSALVDIGRPVMEEGVKRTFGQSLAALQHPALRQALVGEVQRAGTALDVVMNTRALAFSDLSDVFGRRWAAERMLDNVTGLYFLANGLSPWTQTMKSWSGIIISDRILETAGRWTAGTAADTQIAKMARAGIDQDMARRISDQFGQHGQTVNGLRLPNTAAWTDAEARIAYRRALVQDVDRTIITPGDGDRPLFMSQELWQTVLQFKSFGVAAVQRIVKPAMQSRDIETLQGIAVLVGLGYLSNEIRAVLKDDPRHASRPVADKIVAAIDTSGALGIFSDIDRALFDLTNDTVSVRGLVIDQPWQSSWGWKATTIGGPTAGQMRNAWMAFVEGSDDHLRRLLPLYNIPYVGRTFEAAEQAFHD